MTDLRILAAAATACVALAPLAGHAAPVNLTGWIAEEGNGSPAANWIVQGALSDSVFQNRNSRPSVFFNPGSNAQGKALKGTIKVETTSDDDYIGFVLGYNSGEFASSTADFWLVDWKQRNQTGSPGAGLRLSSVTGNVGAATEDDFWAHARTVNIVQTAANLGSTGWADNTEYTFELSFTSSLIEVFVDGVKELSYVGSFTDGAFGFYNYSQTNVRYAGITEEVLPPPPPPPPPGPVPSAVPVPASLPLILAGMGSLGLFMRKRRG